MPKVSIIITAYNVEKYIRRTVESVLRQTFSDFEVIIVNDGSTDQTHEILESLKKNDTRIIICNKKNGGVSSSRNYGIKLASAEYIYQLDGDDWIEENCIEEMYKTIIANEGDILISDFFIDNDRGNVTVFRDYRKSDIPSAESFLYELFQARAVPSMWNKLFKRSLFENLLFPEDVSLGEDLALTPRLFLRARRIVKLNEAYLHYIQHDSSITKNNPSLKAYQLFRSFEIISETLSDYNVPYIIAESFQVYKLNHMINFITSKPFWSEENYIKGFNRTLDLLKKSSTVPIELPKLKKTVLYLLLKFPNSFILKTVINSIHIAKIITSR